MILYKGKLYESSCQDALLKSLPDDLTATLEKRKQTVWIGPVDFFHNLSIFFLKST